MSAKVLNLVPDGAERSHGKAWNVIEEHSHAKNSQAGSEDAIFTSEHCFAVIDGVTTTEAVSPMKGYTPGQFAAYTAIQVLGKVAGTVKDARALVSQLSYGLKSALAGVTVSGRPSYVFAAYLPHLNRIVRVGDCFYLIDGVGENHDLRIDWVKSLLRKHVLEHLIREGARVEDLVRSDPTWPRMVELTTRRQPRMANNSTDKKYGYGVINGEDVPERLIEVIEVPPTAKSIVLTSDGYPFPSLAPTYEETEANFQRLMKEDPLGYKLWLSVRGVNPDTGCFDDRTFLRIGR